MRTSTETITHGKRPTGTARGTERWLTVARDDTDYVLTAYSGWGITDEVRLSGQNVEKLLTPVVENLMSGPWTEGAWWFYNAADGSWTSIPND